MRNIIILEIGSGDWIWKIIETWYVCGEGEGGNRRKVEAMRVKRWNSREECFLLQTDWMMIITFVSERQKFFSRKSSFQSSGSDYWFVFSLARCLGAGIDWREGFFLLERYYSIKKIKVVFLNLWNSRGGSTFNPRLKMSRGNNILRDLKNLSEQLSHLSLGRILKKEVSPKAFSSSIILRISVFYSTLNPSSRFRRSRNSWTTLVIFMSVPLT